MLDYYLIVGYGWSGSSAVVDLLREYNKVGNPDVEFRIVKDPYGLHDLYNSIIKGDQLNIDTAIKDFYWYAKKLYTTPKRFSFESGLNYGLFFGHEFIDITKNFISRIVDFEYQSHWWMFDFKKTKYEVFKERIKNILHFHDDNRTSKMYFSGISSEVFINEVRRYIDELFLDYVNANDIDHIILDQGVSSLSYDLEMNFFSSSKTIIVDRDPRDIYTDLCQGNFLIGKELSNHKNPEKYVKWHRVWRRNNTEKLFRNNILYIQFEDLVLQYDKTVKQIENFLGLSSNDHKQIKTFFDPEKSKKNIGIWRDYMIDSETKIFDKDLKDFYYACSD